MDALPPRAEYGTLRKSAFGRTNLFLKTSNAIFREIRCSASSTTRQASASIYHAHTGNNATEKPESCVCWHCCHGFDGEGFRLPRIYDPTENVYHVYGWFCSANCAKAYILEHSTFDRGYQMNIFVRMLREVYKIDCSINEAPPRMSLKLFGGPFDIESFRKQTNVCLNITAPFISYCMLIEERQPILNIGEQTNPNQRGSVRGLRRPTEVPSMSRLTEDICGGPEEEGMYSEFLKRNEPSTSEDLQMPPPKRTRTSTKAAKTAHGTGLAKFACSKEE